MNNHCLIISSIFNILTKGCNNLR